jgi:hypothetical protein
MNKFRGQCEVTIGGAKQSMVFNTYTFFILCEKLDCDLEGMAQKLAGKAPLRAITVLVWAAFKVFAEENDKVSKLSVSDVASALQSFSQEDSDSINDAIKFAMESVDSTTDVAEGDSPKKK